MASSADVAPQVALRRAARNVLTVIAFAVVPLLLWALAYRGAIDRGAVAVDYDTYWRDSKALLDGAARSSDYPPLAAVLLAPLAILPLGVAEVVATILSLVCAVATLWVLGVRDWRCYGAAALWSPVYSGFQTANVSLALALGVAVLWRRRDSEPVAAAVTALTVAVKLFLWPLGVWLAATRRWRAAALTAVAALVATAAAWVLVDVGSVGAFVDALQGAIDQYRDKAYTLSALVADLGGPDALGTALVWGAGGALLVAAAVNGWRGRDATSLVLVLGAALVVSPIVWTHFLVVLLVPVAVLHRTLHWTWVLPGVLWLCPPVDGSAGQKALVLAILGVMVAALAATAMQRESRQR